LEDADAVAVVSWDTEERAAIWDISILNISYDTKGKQRLLCGCTDYCSISHSHHQNLALKDLRIGVRGDNPWARTEYGKRIC
jgi:hypothetical protein